MPHWPAANGHIHLTAHINSKQIVTMTKNYKNASMIIFSTGGHAEVASGT